MRVVNDNTSDPDGATFKIDYATLTSLDDNTKSDLITNTYTTHGLTVTKALAGDWADYTDHFIFTLEITDRTQTRAAWHRSRSKPQARRA